MFSKCSFLTIFVVSLLFGGSLCCSRRRRRTPTPRNCQWSSWGYWPTCTKNCDVGTQTRTRSKTVTEAYGGTCSGSSTDTRSCGEHNGGCDHTCVSSSGTCRCYSGYKLQGDGKTCEDINECTNGQVSCVNSVCKNTLGSFKCECDDGYYRVYTTKCWPRSCSQLSSLQCPSDAYRDVFGAACLPVEVKYRYGYQYKKEASLTCPENYKLAVISTAASGKKFAEDYSTVDFDSPKQTTTCIWDSAHSKVKWDWSPQETPYYCRRVNDPPSSLVLSNTYLHEGAAVLSTVGYFVARDPQNDQVSFSIENVGGLYYFVIQGNQLLVRRIPVWESDGVNTRTVIIKALDNSSPPMYVKNTFHITILNINNPPRDLELSNNEVSEHAPVGSIVGNLTAIDDDIGPQRSADFYWELVDSDNDVFRLTGNLILVNKPLDHEAHTTHTITVQCSDDEDPRQTSPAMNFFIYVQDENDSPKSVALTNQNVPENSPVGYVVGEIKASDEDSGELYFSLSNSDPKVREKFQLAASIKCTTESSQSGGKQVQTCSINLLVKGDLDYEEENLYELWVTASDLIGDTSKKIEVRVDDVNEIPTAINLTNNVVPEDRVAGHEIGEFLVTDPDNEYVHRQTHVCVLVNSINGDEDSFSIITVNGRNVLEIKLGSSFDYETKDRYKIQVSCNDDSFSITRSFEVFVQNVNEIPTSLSLSNTIVTENLPGLTLIGTLSTTDPEGDDQDFQYTVLTSSSGSFSIGGDKKDKLFINGPVDYELTPSIDVNIRVTDIGGLYLDKTLTLTVQDVNDAPTNIFLSPNSFLQENSHYRVYIGSITVEDEDTDTQPSCDLLDGSNNRVLLEHLNLIVGHVKTDYESLGASKSLQVRLKCSDQHGASFKKWLTVPVRDMNEPPTNLTLSKSEVSENMHSIEVGVLQITDPDVNQRYNCFIKPDDNKMFSVFGLSLRSLQSLNFESARKHTVSIKCQDVVHNHTQESFHIERTFDIHVVDVNEPPVIHCQAPFFISPTFSSGSVIGQINGADPDNERYYKSKTTNTQKQSLTYRFEPENHTLPFEMTLNGIIYLDKQPRPEDYRDNGFITVHIQDDGTLLRLQNGVYVINKSPSKFSVEDCQLVISSNITFIDIQLSSNYVYENATVGTIIGTFSRKKTREGETIAYQILNNTTPFAIDGDNLVLTSHGSLDYERLPNAKVLAITISSRSSVSGVFTKRFLIMIIDVDEEPTGMCIFKPEALQDCSVLGYILIEDLDHPDIRCDQKNVKIDDLRKELSEYTCVVDVGENVLSNQINRLFSTEDKLTVVVNMDYLTEVKEAYEVRVVCRNERNPVHVIEKTFHISKENFTHPTCRNSKLCRSCPEPKYCLTHISAVERCVGQDYRISASVSVSNIYFKDEDFVLPFERYVESLIEGTSNGKTLDNVVTEFDDENKPPVRRRREATTYNNVYVELFIVGGDTEKTLIEFTVANNLNQKYKLILASEVCKLLKGTQVECVLEENVESSGQGQDSGSSIMWVVYIGIGFAVMVIVVAIVVWRRRRSAKQRDNPTPPVSFARNDDVGSINYETPTHRPGQIEQCAAPRRKTEGYDNPVCGRTDEKTRSYNPYVYEQPVEPTYSTIDDILGKIRKEVEPGKPSVVDLSGHGKGASTSDYASVKKLHTTFGKKTDGHSDGGHSSYSGKGYSNPLYENTKGMGSGTDASYK